MLKRPGSQLRNSCRNFELTSQLLLEIDDLLDLREKPPVNSGQLKDFLDGEPCPKGVPDKKDAFGIGDAELLHDDFSRENVAIAKDFFAKAPRFAIAAQTMPADL